MVSFVVTKPLVLRYGQKNKLSFLSLVIPSVGMTSLASISESMPRQIMRASVTHTHVNYGSKSCRYGLGSGSTLGACCSNIGL